MGSQCTFISLVATYAHRSFFKSIFEVPRYFKIHGVNTQSFLPLSRLRNHRSLTGHVPLFCRSCLDTWIVAHHILHYIIGLPILECGPQALVAVVLVIGLVLVILNPYEIRVDRHRVKRERYQRVDGRHLRDELEMPFLPLTQP